MKSLQILLLAAFVDMLGFAMVFPLLPFYAVRLGADAQVVGWMVASFSIAQVASAPVWGRLSDRWGRRPALLIGLLGSALAFSIFAFANALWLLFAMRLVQGGSGGTTGVMQAYIGDSVAPEDRAKALGWLSAATSGGVMLGPAIGSLAWSLGSAAPGLIAASLCLLNFLFALRSLPESRPSPPAQPEGAGSGTTNRPAHESVGKMFWATLRHPRGDVARLIWIYAVAMMAFSSLQGVLGLFLMNRFQLTEANIGYVFVYLGALSVVLRAGVLGYLIHTLGEVRVMHLGAILLAVGLGAYPLPGSFFMLLPVMALVPMGTALLFPSASGLLSRRGPKHQLGQLYGVQQSFGGLARIVGPIWAGTAFSKLGPAVPFWVAGAIVAVVAFLVAQVRPEPRSMAAESVQA